MCTRSSFERQSSAFDSFVVYKPPVSIARTLAFRAASSSTERHGACRLVSSHLVSSRLVASRLVASRLVSSRRLSSRRLSSRLVSSRRLSSRLVSSRRVSSRLVASRCVALLAWGMRRLPRLLSIDRCVFVREVLITVYRLPLTNNINRVSRHRPRSFYTTAEYLRRS